MKQVKLNIMGREVTINWVGEGRKRLPLDPAERYSDEKLAQVRARLTVMYRSAADDLIAKQQDWLHAHEKRVEKYRAQVEAGLLSEQDYQAWMQGQLFQEKAWALKRGQMARAMADIDKQAMAMINDGKIDVFAENANWMCFQIESDLGAFGTFGLYDRQTVTRLVRDRPNLLPMPEIDEERDYQWYNGVINNAVTQGIIQGETLEDIVLRVAEETGKKADDAMKRNARTAYTGAQAAGREESMRQARDDLNIDVKKKWLATFDDKTRNAHAELDGKTADIDEPFESLLGPIMFPGDPDATPANVYNCRCRLGRAYGKYDIKINRVDAGTGETVGDMNYREWQRKYMTEDGKKAG